MKFYDRKQELKILEQLRLQTGTAARMTVLTGRRRVGKTKLALEFAKSHKHLYLFVAKKSEQLLCEDFLTEIKGLSSLPVFGEIRSFKDIFALLLEISKKEKFTLIIDEFQEFYTINPTVFLGDSAPVGQKQRLLQIESHLYRFCFLPDEEDI